MKNTDNLQTLKIDSLITPKKLKKKYPISSSIKQLISKTREKVSRILTGQDTRLLVIMGPCSIHDPISALEYAQKLSFLRNKFSDSLEIIMRTYFEKPRTVIGWKGLISDPYLDGTFQVNEGLEIARKLLIDINKLNVPAATEFLDITISRFISDLISWGAIGARTTESQIHREMASSLLLPIGFKNGTDGNISIAIDAIRSAKSPHLCLSPDENGKINITCTPGNPFVHIIMRGGKIPNYHKKDIEDAIKQLRLFNLPEYLMIDFSHANSLKQHYLQLDVADSVSKQITSGSCSIAGVMIESFLKEGAQKVDNISNLIFGQSITDPCLGWNESVQILEKLSYSVLKREKNIL